MEEKLASSGLTRNCPSRVTGMVRIGMIIRGKLTRTQSETSEV